MRRIIAVRKRNPVFGRGTIEFLDAPNHHVIAYVRRDHATAILCVANLSRFVQPVTLDLAGYEGRVPVELIGETRFPQIERAPYFLSLGPHGFYWFRLELPS